jgi:hypothetical protein
MLNYIIDVKHLSKIGEKYNKLPLIIDFNNETQYNSLSNIFK